MLLDSDSEIECVMLLEDIIFPDFEFGSFPVTSSCSSRDFSEDVDILVGNTVLGSMFELYAACLRISVELGGETSLVIIDVTDVSVCDFITVT